MKNSWLLVIALSYINLSSSISKATPITLEEAFKSAIEKTESVPLLRSRVRESAARVDEVKSHFFPFVSGSANYQIQEKEIGSLGNRDQATVKLTLTQSLFAGGRDRANLRAKTLEQNSQEQSVFDSKNTLYMLVSKSFFTLLSANREVDNINTSIELMQKRIAELQKRKKIGKSRNIEVLAAEAQLSVLEAQLLAAVGEKRTAKNAFANATGLDRNTTLDDTAVLPKEVKGLQAFLSSIDRRPDVLGLQASVESSEWQINSASAGHLPSVDFATNYYLYRYRFLQNGADWDAVVSLTMPLFSGGIVQAQVSEASERKTQAELELRRRRRDAEMEIHSAYNNLVSALEQVRALEKAVSATGQNYQEQEKDYRYSLATNLDVLQALNTLHETKRTLDRTRYHALSALAELKAAANQVEL